MEQDGGDLLTTASAALEAGDWTAAKDAFQAALDVEETPEAHVGLGEAAWWLGDLQQAVACREQAYAGYRRRPDPGQAAFVALMLCFDHLQHVGSRATASGWLGRAARLIDDHAIEPMRGWLLFIRSCLEQEADPDLSLKLADEAVAHAREQGDADLELCALSQAGAALVGQGRVAEGVARLDEALAGSLGGEGRSLETVVFTSCNMITSCNSCADYERAVEWIRAADRFTQRYGCPFLYVECRTFYGRVLLATGQWEKAEAELLTALELSAGSVPVLHHETLASLAELRLAQGRLEEAERLIQECSDEVAAAPVLARLHLLAGRPAAAAATAQRALQAVGGGLLESAALLELQGEAEIASGDRSAAADRGRRLAESGADLDCRVMQARGERLLGRALAARDRHADGGGTPRGGVDGAPADGVAHADHADADGDGAREHLDAAVSQFMALRMPHEVARTRLLLAEAVHAAEPEVAEAEARAALATLEELGAGGDADAAAALLRRLGVKAARSGPRNAGTLTKREQEVLGLLGEGLSNPEIAARLYLSRKTVEHHVARVLAKLGVSSRAQAAAKAVRSLGSPS